MADNELCRYRKFLSSQTQCFFRYFKRHPLNFKNKTPRGYWCYISFWITFPFTHTYIQRLLCNRFIWKNTHPNLTLPLHISCNSNTSSLNLSTCNPFCTQ